MEPTFVARDAFTVTGIQERFTPEAKDFEGIWRRFMAPDSRRTSSLQNRERHNGHHDERKEDLGDTSHHPARQRAPGDSSSAL